ncbi:peptidase C1B, bleomycin hydrolase [Phyllosticta citrichinensis]|uniref:Cysteine proteinase 1, mitochondrial n=1 Tax=Phyllosticta citrichinensis TaxID=1130410 RepID=A0ABR1Y4M6_9PEZI
MGISQSKPQPEAGAQEKLSEALRALELRSEREIAEKDYVYIENGPPPTYKLSEHQQTLSVDKISQWEKEVLQDDKNLMALNAFTANDTNSILKRRSTVIGDTQIFNVKIPFEGSPVTNQRASGRCWLFASTNVFRVAIMKKYKLEKFELSQAYLFYWDKIEKANYFLENILQTAEDPLDGRLLQTLLASPVGDGGQWDMVANLVEKYGLVPQSLYPDAYNAMNSSLLNRLVTTKLREHALRLRKLASSPSLGSRASLGSVKEKMMQEIHLILTLMLGPPPSPKSAFEWQFYDKDGAYHNIQARPTEFAKELSDARTVKACGGTDVHRLFSLVNDPRNSYNTLLTVSRLGNVWGGRPVTYVNVDIMTIKKAVIETLKRGIPVFFGSDVGKYSDSSNGIMDTALFDYELAFNTKLALSKAERLTTGESAMTHAMVLTGVHLDEKTGEPVRWRVENSWSASAGTDGYFVMSDKWMDEFVYQAVVDPSVVSKEVRDVLKQGPKVLDLWDPMGALA